MRERLEYDVKIAPSLCDHSGKLGIPEAFSLFQDIASTHAESLGLGYHDLLKRDLYWLTVKTKIIIGRRPSLSDTVTVRTWPEAPGKLRCNRSYELDCGGETVITGRTEWAIINFRDNSLFRVSDFYPADLVLQKNPVFQEPFARIPEVFGEFEPYYEYTVSSTDIDVGAHMNNVAYIRAIAGSFSCEEWDELPKRNIELQYRSPCFEGDRLVFSKHSSENGLDIRIAKGDTTLLLARMQ